MPRLGHIGPGPLGWGARPSSNEFYRRTRPALDRPRAPEDRAGIDLRGAGSSRPGSDDVSTDWSQTMCAQSVAERRCHR